MKKKYDFIIKGAYGGSNFGDDLLMLAIVHIIKKTNPTSSIGLILNRKSKYIENYNLNTDLIYPDNTTDIVTNHLILGGGTQYFEFYKSKKNKFKDFFIKLFNIKKVIKKLKQKRKYNLEFTSCSAISFGIGPFHSKNTINYFEAIKNLKKCTFLSIRDYDSEKFCKQNNIQYIKHTDICFNLDNFGYKYPLSNANKVTKIGIIVRDWIYDDNNQAYIFKLIKVSKELKSKGYDVDFITFTPISDSYVTSILKEKKENIIIYNPDIYNIDQFITILSDYNLLISARAHGAIVATYLGIPTILIEIEPKLKNIEMEITKKQLLWSPYIDKEEKLINLVYSISNNYSYWKNTVFTANKHHKSLVDALLCDYEKYLKELN